MERPGLPESLMGLLLAVGVMSGGCAPEERAPAEDASEPYELVVLDGRVLDPASGLDAVRHLGIRQGRIAAVAERPLEGRDTLRAEGLVVAPGFIDLHAHGQDEENHRLFVRDGVTTALELELGTADVETWYAEREGAGLINYGASAGHVPVRMAVLGDRGERLPVGPAARDRGTDAEIGAVIERLRQGLAAGAPALGMSLQNTPAAGREEVRGAFRAAAEAGVPVHVHVRHMGSLPPEDAESALEEVLAAAEETGSSLHVAHVHSSGLASTEALLERIAAARERGVDVTTEVYPYTAGQTNLEAPLFEEGWQERLGIGYEDVRWAATGEPLTRETFDELRRQGGLVIIHMIPEQALRAALRQPFTLIASDGLIREGRGHPRAAGTYARVLARYVREESVLDLMDAVRRMSLEPARRLEAAVPGMRDKGRITEGADADVTIFDPALVQDRATYDEPLLPPEGIPHVLVNGVPVVRDGRIRPEAGRPGRPVRTIDRHLSTSRTR